MPFKKKEEQQVVSVTLKKRIIAMHPHYRKSPYMFAIPQSQATRAYMTGQDLSLDKCTEQPNRQRIPLSKEDVVRLEMGPEPYIIDPMAIYPIHHNRTFDLSYVVGENGEDKVYKNPRDYAEFKMFTLDLTNPESECVIAPSKKEYRKQKHYFYVEDKEQEAKETLEVFEQSYEAERFVREDLGTGRWKDLILLLNFEVTGYNIDPNMLSDSQIKTHVLKACREHPEAVLKMKGSAANQVLFAIKLIRHKIIVKKNGTDFYYGDMFVGVTIDSLTTFINASKNAAIVTKWQQMVDKYEAHG